MSIFSIDLGIDAGSTGGAEGTQSDPYPLQIAICEGTLEKGVFQPIRIASWRELVSNDELIFRVFDITLPGDPCGLSRSLVGVESITPLLRDRCGQPLPLTTSGTAQITPAPVMRRALTFKDPSTSDFTCYFARDTTSGAVAHYELPRLESSAVCLLSVVVVARLQEGSESTPRVYREDPEMVVSPTPQLAAQG